jgi:hypothetical protein
VTGPEQDTVIDLRICLPLSLETLDELEAILLDADPGLYYRGIEWPAGSPIESFGEPLHLACLLSEWRFG